MCCGLHFVHIIRLIHPPPDRTAAARHFNFREHQKWVTTENILE